MKRGGRIIAAFAMLAAGLGMPAHASSGGCATGSVGADWPLYGRDLSNSRTSPDTGISTATVGNVAARWVLDVTSVGAGGALNSTPVEADGCVYVATSTGDVLAVNADTGQVVWHVLYAASTPGLGGSITGDVVVDNGRVLIPVNEAGAPYVAAVDQFTGAEVWRTVVDTSTGEFINASPVPFNGMIFMGFSGDEGSPNVRGGYAILRATDGALLDHEYTIPDAAFQAGYWGTSVWTTAAIDPVAGFAYAGGGNPASKDKEYRTSNSLLKIDVDPNRSTFGKIVDIYKGATDQYYPGLDRQPVCNADPDVNYVAWSATCLQFDLDFGASPTLYRDSHGNQMLGALQKAGILHGVFTDTMEQAWTQQVGVPCFACNAASPASDNGSVFAVGSIPGQAVAVNGDTGGVQWLAPLADGAHYYGTTVANHVVYNLDTFGNLNAVDEVSGLPLLKRNLAQDVGKLVTGLNSSGIAVARNEIIVGDGGFVVAYR